MPVLAALMAFYSSLAIAQDTKPPVPPPVTPATPAATPPVANPATTPNMRATKQGVVDAKDPNAPGAPGAPKLPAQQPGTPTDPLFIPDIPQGPAMPGVPQGPDMVPQKPPMQRMYTVGKFVVKYGTDVRERNPKLPSEAELSASVVTLLEGQGTALFHIPKHPAAGAAKAGAGLFGVTSAEQNERAEANDEDQALHPPEAAPTAPAAPVAPATTPGAKPAKTEPAKKEPAKPEKNAPKVIPKPSGKVVKMKVSDFAAPRGISAMALLDVYDALVKKLTDRGLIGVYILTELNPRLPNEKEADLRAPGVLDVNVTVWVSEVAKVRTIARKIAPNSFKLGNSKKGEAPKSKFTEGDLPKINDDDAPDGMPVKDPRHLWIKAKSPVYVFNQKKGGGLLEKPRLQDYLSRLNRFPGRRVDAAINATGETGKVMLDYLIREQKRFVVYAQESNNGTKSTGEWRSRLGVELRQLLNMDDVLRMEYTTTDLNRFNSGILVYQMALAKPDLLKLKVYGLYGEFSAEDVGFSGANFTGDSLTAGMALTWTPKYWHGFPLDLTIGGDFMRVTVNNASTGGDSAVNLILPYLAVGTERTTDKFSLATNWQAKGSFDSKNQDQLNGLGRFDTDGSFWYLTGDLSASIFLEPLILGKKWGDLGKDGTKWKRGILANEIAVLAHAQYALGNRRLIPQLELINGGYNTVRGYPESFTSGDSGYSASIEYRLHVPRLFKPADLASSQKAAKVAEKKDKADKIARVSKAVGTQKPETNKTEALKPETQKPGATAQGEKVVTTGSERGGSPSFRLRPVGAGAGADWDLIIRGFFDYGQTFNNRIQSSVEVNRTLASVGGGIELQIFKPLYMTIRADYGYVIQGQSDLLVTPVEAGDNRIHISATIAW
jgi:hemolysin activation/secretion protein